MKILIVGANGQLGTELSMQLHSGMSELGPIPHVYKQAEVVCADIPDIDITDQAGICAYVAACKPDIIFNCAAYTNVDGCETHQDDAFRVNAIGVRNLATAAERVSAKLLHLSTDYIFAGDSNTPYKEIDLPNPQSVYGATKLAGEQYVREFCSRWFIVRTAWLYGYHGKNFVKTMLNLAKTRDSIMVVNDQRGNPTNAVDLAYHLLKIAATEEYGVYHCTGKGECSWFDFASKIMELKRMPVKVSPCTTAEYASPTRRPAYSSLDHMMLRLTVGDEMRPWEEALACYMENI